MRFDFSGAMLFIGFVVALVCAFASGTIADKKGYGYSLYALLGLLLGIIGLIIAACLPTKEQKKPVTANELVGYKQLLDAGVINEDEFLSKKKELLGSSSEARAKTRVNVKSRMKDGVEREYWTCPECSKSWYVKGEATSAKCGNAECSIRVALER